ncbi:MAG: hypothetical protein ACRD2B_03005 [Terriglobia bacterium]
MDFAVLIFFVVPALAGQILPARFERGTASKMGVLCGNVIMVALRV